PPAVRAQARGDRRPNRVRAQLERAASERRARSAERREAHRRALFREGGVTAVKVLGISGSLRRDSYNTKLLRAAGELLPPFVELEVWDELRAVPPFDEDEELGPAPAAVESLREAVAGADGIVFATPEYNASIPGQPKY